MWFSSYSRLEKEDPDELQQRKRMFLIYKVMGEADMRSRRRSLNQRRVYKLKIKFSKRLTMFESHLCGAPLMIMNQVKHLKRVLCG